MSTATILFNSYHLGKLRLCIQNRSYSSAHSTCAPWISTAKHGYCNTTRQHIRWLSINRRARANRTFSMDPNAINNLPVPPIPSGSSPFPGWSKWMLFTIIPIFLPFLTNKWGPLLALKQKFDTTLQTISNITEIIEDVAEVVDEIADDVSEKLPQGSKLRTIVETIDDIAEKTIKGADCAEEILQKVDDIGDKVEAVIKQSVKDNESLKKQLEVATTDTESLKKQLEVTTTDTESLKKQLEAATSKAIEEK